MQNVNSKFFWRIVRILRPIKRNIERLIRLPFDYSLNKKLRKKVKEKYKAKDLINVCFILQFPEMWNSFKSVYDAFARDCRFRSIVITVPKRKGVGADDSGFEEFNAASDFCSKNDINYIDAKNSNGWISISSISPDIVFIQRPYDENMPKHLTLQLLSRDSILCYVPYCYEYGADIHLEYVYNRSLINNVFCCFPENDYVKDFINRASRIDSIIGIRKVYSVGFPRFDLIKTLEADNYHRTNFLWTPRWSVNEINDRSHFLDYYNPIIDYFSNNPNLNLSIRPHPLMFKNFVENDILSQIEVDRIKTEIDSLENVNWDNNVDYMTTFENVDVLISDYSSLIVEFFVYNKPIIYCGGNVQSLNPYGKEMAKGLYHVQNREELINCVIRLIEGENQYFETNKKTIMTCFRKKENIGMTIKDKIVENFLL